MSALPGIDMSSPNPAAAMMAAAQIGQTIESIHAELVANRERTDALIIATNRQTEAIETLSANLEQGLNALKGGGIGGLLKLAKG